MISLIGILGLFLTLSTTSDALSCTQCMSASSTCSGSSMTCPSGHVCASQYSESTVGGLRTQTLLRLCSPPSQCSINGSISTSQLQLRMAASCCDTDNCTPDLPELPTKSTNSNGLVCRSCISADSTWCYTPDTIQCTGDENMCLLQSTKISGSPSTSTAIRGCATKSICDLGSKTETFGGLTVDVKTHCTSGNKSDALSCTQCMSPSSSCSGNNVTCPSGHVCASQYSESTIGGGRTEMLLRLCSPPSECSTKGSISTSQLQLRMAASCCGSDNCTPDLPALPTKSTNPNGLVCRSCISADSTWCHTPDTVQCSGDENMCLLQSTKISGSPSSSTAIRGCATKSICDLGSQTETLGGVSVDVKTVCTSGSKSVHKVVLNPAVVCFLLLKLFF
ncbi:urokinase plasminogen activator surface receptor-like [Ranitomeya imitator]|uniref:urokinase plasminogen activator surface receptor-like n=1 Tax=Ranitomeya imitator TaxID=111125 RepID=UPI0037E7E368